MSVSDSEDKPDSKWSWYWVLGLGLLLLIGLGAWLFGLYYKHFPYVSDSPNDWSTFGSLLGGFSASVGVFATLATLLFLNHQNQTQQKFIVWQLKSQKFDQYVNHRRLVIERLGGLQIVLGNSIRFVDPEELYTSLFPKNHPANVDFVVKPNRVEGAENLLGRIGSSLEKLETLLKEPKWTGTTSHALVDLLVDIASDFGYEWVKPGEDGDIIYLGTNYGINIYSLTEFVDRAKSIYNSFLSITGNPPFRGFEQGISGNPRDALMRYFVRRYAPKHSVVALKVFPPLQGLEELCFEVDDLRDDLKNWLMPKTHRQLASIFSSRSDVLSLRDIDFFISVIHSGSQEAYGAAATLAPQDPRCDRLRECGKQLAALVNYVR